MKNTNHLKSFSVEFNSILRNERVNNGRIDINHGESLTHAAQIRSEDRYCYSGSHCIESR